MSPLSTFPWKVLESELEKDTSSTLILDILKQTCDHLLCHKFPPSVKYRRVFLTELIKMQERTKSEPSDELYDALGEVMCTAEGTDCFKSYLMPHEDAVSLRERVSVISEGTTGLVTWEAALYLAEWAMVNQQVFTDRTVLELGSGVGLTGMVICRSCSPLRYLFSDCHHSVLENLKDNVQLNGLTSQQNCTVSVEELDWGNVSQEWLSEIGPDTVIASDVVYDPDIIVCLVKLLSSVLRRDSPAGPPDVYISSTIRNPDTYNGFKNLLENVGINHEVMDRPARHVFSYNRDSKMELIKLYI
ncbi:protein-lysine N-methyltransferase EEF2KMT [Aplochiton taeniatus]